RETGTLYVAFLGGVLHGTEGNWSCWPRNVGIPDGEVQRIELAPNGDVWVLTSLGAARYRDGNGWTRFVPPQLPSGTIHGIGFIDDEVWLSTDAGATIIGQDDALTHIDAAPALSFVKDIATDEVIGQGVFTETRYSRAAPYGVNTRRQLANHRATARPTGGAAVPSQVKAWVQAPNGDAWAGSETGVREEPPRFEVTSIDTVDVVQNMVIDDDGAIYLGDGRNFIRVTTTAVPQVEHLTGYIRILTMTHSNADIYLATGAILYRYRTEEGLVQLGRAPGNNGDIHHLYMSDDTLWVSHRASTSLFLFDTEEEAWTEVSDAEFGASYSFVTNVFETPRGHLNIGRSSEPDWMIRIDGMWLELEFLGSPRGFGEIQGNTFALGSDKFAVVSDLGVQNRYPFQLSSTGSVTRVGNSVWFRWYDNRGLAYVSGIAELKPDGSLSFHDDNLWRQNAIEPSRLVAENDHTLWLGYNQGNGGLDRIVMDPIVKNAGLPAPAQHIFATETGHAEFATGHWSYVYSESVGFQFKPQTEFLAAAYQADGRPWVAIGADGLARGLERYNSASGLAGDNARDVINGADNSIWVATEGGVSRFTGNQFVNFDLGGAGNDVRKLVMDREQRIWAATGGGVFVYDGVGFDGVTGLPGTDVKDITVDARGVMWAATTDGLGRRTGATAFVAFDLREGAQPSLTSVDTMNDGRVIVGSAEDGVFIIHPNGIVDNFTVDNGGLPSNRVSDVFSEKIPDGRTWIATTGGLSEYAAPPGIIDQPFCGDGLVAATEACDDGGVQTGRCEEDCRLPTCGDLVVNEAAGEDCDDGNDDNTDDCIDTCKTARCGDGFIEQGVERCDNVNDPDFACDASQCFLSSARLDLATRCGVEGVAFPDNYALVETVGVTEPGAFSVLCPDSNQGVSEVDGRRCWQQTGNSFSQAAIPFPASIVDEPHFVIVAEFYAQNRAAVPRLDFSNDQRFADGQRCINGLQKQLPLISIDDNRQTAQQSGLNVSVQGFHRGPNIDVDGHPQPGGDELLGRTNPIQGRWTRLMFLIDRQNDQFGAFVDEGDFAVCQEVGAPAEGGITLTVNNGTGCWSDVRFYRGVAAE
ncbi:MAG: hypothetical protein ACON3Z_11785, partial [Bradymonadia bacterium]